MLAGRGKLRHYCLANRPKLQEHLGEEEGTNGGSEGGAVIEEGDEKVAKTPRVRRICSCSGSAPGFQWGGIRRLRKRKKKRAMDNIEEREILQ